MNGEIFGPSVSLFVRLSLPQGHQARPEAQLARPEAQPARPEAQPTRSVAQPARPEAQPTSHHLYAVSTKIRDSKKNA